jgi:hypothetical protein
MYFPIVNVIGSQMRESDLFPIEALPSRIKDAVLTEFHGRCPTVLEVARTPDSHWLTVPNMGCSSLAQLRSVTKGVRRNVGIPTLSGLSDAELLTHARHTERQLSELSSALKSYRTELQMRGITLPRLFIRARDL